MICDIIKGLINESDNVWGEGRNKKYPQKIIVKTIRLNKNSASGEVEYGITAAISAWDHISCWVFLPKKLHDDVIAYVRLTVPEYIIKAFNGEIALEKKTIENIKNKIGELSIDNALNDQKLRDNLIKIALKDHSVIRKLNTAARSSEVNLMLYVIHHEGNHIASALITLHRNTCVLNSWAEIWIDFCTRLERAHIEGAVLRLPVSGHIKFAEYIIDRAETNGKSLEEILEAIWRYCFDLDISPERAREILGENLNIETEHIKKLEKMKKVAKAVDYCNNKIPNFNFSLSLTKKTSKKKGKK